MKAGHGMKVLQLSCLFLPLDLLGFPAWGDQVLVSKVFTFTMLLLGWERLRKATWLGHLSWPLSSQTLLSQGISSLNFIIGDHYTLRLYSTFCQVLYHLKKYF